MIFGGFRRRRLQEHSFDALAGELLDDQNLVGIATAQTIRGMDQDGFDAALTRGTTRWTGLAWKT